MSGIGDIEELYSTEEKKLISSLLLRLLQCNRTFELYSSENIDFFCDLYFKNSVKKLSFEEELYKRISNQIIYLFRNESNKGCVNKIIKSLESNNNIVVLNDTVVDESKYDLRNINSQKSLSLYGPFFNYKKNDILNNFRILAIIHIFNEADVIEQTTNYLLSQGIDVFLVDNWSSDASYEIIQKLSEKYPQNVFYKRFPESGSMGFYDWYHQLELTEEISKETDYSWYIHYDADEYRITPWKDTTLKEAIFYIDSLGYNVIENTVIDFKVTETNNNSIFMKDTWFEFGHRPAHFEQTKTWKKSESIDLKSSGGHIAKVDNPKVFPLKILNRHYPFRTFEHAKKKIFLERKPRFAVESESRGWHGHYNKINKNSDIIVKTDNLLYWNENTFDELYIQLFTGCGIDIECKEMIQNVQDFDLDIGENVYLYGAGKIGKLLYDSLSREHMIIAWVDRNYLRIQPMKGRCIEDVTKVLYSDNRIIIAVENKDVFLEIRQDMIDMGVSEERLIWKKPKFEK